MAELVAVILAAGKGTRMKSTLPKVLHQVGGQPMVKHVMKAAQEAGAVRNLVVTGFGAEEVESVLKGQAEFVLQAEQLGTGHAVMQVEQALAGFDGDVMVLCGDTPLLRGSTLKKVRELHETSQAAATMLTAFMPDAGYGRVIRNEKGHVCRIVEKKDANPEELAVKEYNPAIYCFQAKELFAALKQVNCHNAQKEYYLTDVIGILASQGKKVEGTPVDDYLETMGINSRVQLAEAEQVLRRRKLERLMEDGVTIMDPASTFVDDRVAVGNDTVIYPFTWLEGETVIGSNCAIGPNTRIQNSRIGSGVEISFTYAHDCQVDDRVTVGPYVHLRPHTHLTNGVKVGNFVEVKNSRVGEGSKLPHLSYIGDSDIGAGVNIGCGTITVNYDGKKKHRTVIEDNAFVGCNSNLVAPVEIGTGAYVAAGSTITKNVPADALGVARARQSNLEGWAAKRRD